MMRDQVPTAGVHDALPSVVPGMIAPVIFCLCVLVLLRLFIRSPPEKRQRPAPIARTFLTRREQAMLGVLEQVLPHGRIHAQVSMGALLDASRILGRRRHIADRNAFSPKIVDFLLQDRASGRLVGSIEIDDFSICQRGSAPGMR